MYYVKRGRKRFVITEELMRRLPEYGTASHFARCLGISRAALCQWIHREGLPVNRQYPVYDQFEAHYIIVHEHFLEWAKATGRYTPPLLANRDLHSKALQRQG